MGELFLNYEHVVNSIRLLGKEFPGSRVTISTLGTRPDLIRALAHMKFDVVLKIHLSLHATDDALRKKIMPGAHHIIDALDALAHFSSPRQESVKINYVLIDHLNDSENHALALAQLIKPYRFTVKLSTLNEFHELKSSDMSVFDRFEDILHSEGISTCRFLSTGTDIKAGCGQLRRYYYEK